jgi:tetratricopeptide (TPR) repeat protein
MASFPQGSPADIQRWLKLLDQILESNQFETAQEAEAWLEKNSAGLSIEEFLRKFSPTDLSITHLDLANSLSTAEKAETPEIARSILINAISDAHIELKIPIKNATSEQQLWFTDELFLLLKIHLALAATYEVDSMFDEAIDQYKEMILLNSADFLNARQRLFSLYIMLGHLADARIVANQFPENQSSETLYHLALLRFLEAADEAEQAHQQTGDDEAAASWKDEKAASLIHSAFQQNPFLPLLMGHPRSFDLECPSEASLGSPAEAIIIMYSQAHLWLSDFLAFSWLNSESKKFQIKHTSWQQPFDDEWKSLIELLGGELTDAERIEFLQSLEELDL